jgi:hypothetical protein
MSTTEDRARAAMRAIAGTVHDAPPLRLAPAEDLAPASDEAGLGGHGPHRPGGADRPGRSNRGRSWRPWLVPLTAAAAIVALAIALVLVKDVPRGGAVPENPSSSTAGPGGAPRYYVALEALPAKTKAKVPAPTQVFSIQFGIVVGDSLTGKTLATFTPPARTTFLSVSAAADDRTFAVFAVTSSTGSFELSMKDGRPTDSITLTGSWYEVRLAPGTAHAADLSLLPIKPWSWSLGVPPAASPGQVDSMALSESGQELAVADIPEVPAAGKPKDWQEVKVFSVATGKLLHDWTANDPMATIGTALPSTVANVPTGTPALTWVDGDQAVTLATSHETVTKTSATMTGTVRRLNMAGSASGNLMTDSTVIWSGTLPWNQSKGCFQVDGWPPLVSADGNTISCLTWDMPAKTPGHVDFDTYPLVTGRQPTLNYRAMIPPEDKTGGLDASVLWVSPSADTLIVAWGGPGLKPSTGAHFGVISHGKFTPLPLQANRAALTAMSVTF